MSKGPDGPSAQSFEKPTKVGWLQKHGGSGMSSHWKKRWFIADHHYLFYFKGPSDKKPVGILCLPEYQSCRKADNKECKKANSFILDRGSDSDGDGPSKNYILHADSESDVESWIAAIKEEMKPILGDSGFSSYSKNTPKPKIDQKAFDEVTASASEGPKLSHPTASRPKPRGRRPPRRYAVFHEDDSKDDDSPTITPSSSSTSLSTKPPSPSSTPSSSPKPPNKGSHPAGPILPKVHMTPPTKPRSATTEPVESGSSTPKIKPEPPKKVTSKDKQNSIPSQDGPPKVEPKPAPKIEPKPAPKPSPRPPVLPKKLSAPVILEPSIQVDRSAEPVGEHKPTPSVKPKPTPPRTKPRSSFTSSIEEPTPASSVDIPPPPQPKPHRSSMSPEPEVVQAPVPVPLKKPRPVPVPRKPEAPKPVASKPPPPSEEEEKLQATEPFAEGKVVEVEFVVKEDEHIEAVVEVETSVTGNGIVHVELEEKNKIESKNDKEESKNSAENQDSEEVKGSVDAEENSTYENVSSNEQNDTEDIKEQIKNNGLDNYEKMDYEEKESPKLNGSETERDQNQFAYVEMSPGVIGQTADSSQDKSNDYEPVVVVEEDDSDSKNDYEMPQWSEQDIASARSSGGFVPMVLTSNLQNEKMVIYDVPPAPRPAYDDRPVSTATSDSPMASQSLEAGSRSNSITSNESSSSSSKNSSDILSQRNRAESKEKESQAEVTVIITTDPTPHLEQRLESLEDSIEKFESPQNGTDKPSDTSNIYDKREAETVAKALQQAKEILRLAKAAKAEADQIKEESTRELELAKRERHDAALMKKNAAEILRMAKTKLGK